MLAPEDANRPSVAEVKETKFYLLPHLSKEQIQKELKRRKRKVDEEKKAEANKEGVISRELLFDLLKDLPDHKKPCLPDSPLLLRSLLQNGLHDRMNKIVTSEKVEGGYRSAVLEALKGVEVTQSLIVQEMDEIAKEKSSEEVWLNFAKTALNGATMEQEEFRKASGLSTRNAEDLQKALRKAPLGEIDDWPIVSEMAQLDDIKIPLFEHHRVLNNSFKTDVSFGLLAYCLTRFTTDKGKMEVRPGEANIDCTLKIKKTVILPIEKDGKTEWKKGNMNVTLKMLISLAYCETLKTNIVTFRNTSDDAMTMQEFIACVQEITKNPHYNLSKFIHGRIEEEEILKEDEWYVQ